MQLLLLALAASSARFPHSFGAAAQIEEGLEELARKSGTDRWSVGTDKGRDRHGYTDVYAMLFDDKRTSITNMTELGTAQGKSVLMWSWYFPRAHIFTVDVAEYSEAIDRLRGIARVHRHIFDGTSEAKRRNQGFADESMDLVIDDAGHDTAGMRKNLRAWWPSVRRGGHYIVEDVAAGGGPWGEMKGGARNGFAAFVHAPDEHTARVLQENDVFFANTAVGHQDFNGYRAKMGPRWVLDKVNHNSNMLVIRKRHSPRTGPVNLDR